MASISVVASRVRDQLDDDLRVAGRLEVGALAFELVPQIAEVDQVAVVRDGDQAPGRIDADGLRIQQGGVAGGRIASVADGQLAGQLGEHVFGRRCRRPAPCL